MRELGPGEARSPEQIIEPDIRLLIDVDGVSDLTFEDEQAMPILFENKLPAPVQSVSAHVDGCSASDGKYTLRGEIQLGDMAPGRAQAAFENFAFRQESVSVSDEVQTYLFNRDGVAYLVYLQEDMKLGLITSGDYDKKLSVDEQKVASLRHGNEDEDLIVVDFLRLQTNLLKEVYRVQGKKIPGIQLQAEPAGDIAAPAENPEPGPRITLDDLGGLHQVKEQLREVITLLQYPDILNDWGVDRPNGILLYGPPGTGKTRLAEAMAGELQAELITVTSDKIYDSSMGGSEKNFQAILDKAMNAATPVVLFFDEIDGIIRPKAGSAYTTVAAQFKQNMARITEQNPNVLVMATTNEPDNMDEALLRAGRFDIRLHVPRPNQSERGEIFATIITQYIDKAVHRVAFDAGDLDLSALVAATDEMTGADIATILKRAVVGRSIMEVRTGIAPEPLTTADILRVISQHRLQ